jgi:hypothetical protein
MKKCNLYGSLSTPPPNVQTCQIGQIEAITVTALETWRSQTQTNCFKGFPHTTAHLGLPQNERNKAYKTLPKWWDPRISKIHVHCSCKHRYVSAPLICEFIAFIAARLQSFLCTWAIATANHLMGIHQELPLQWQLPGHGSDINAISTHRTVGCGRKVSASAVPASSGWCYQTSK